MENSLRKCTPLPLAAEWRNRVKLRALNNTQTKVQSSSTRGFSLIELMTCIIIIALISTFAVPLYQDHVNRARLLEGITLVGPVKAAVQEKGLIRGFEKINSNASAGIGSPESFAGESLETITVLDGGKIEVAYHHTEGKLMLVPQFTSGIMRWNCSSESESYNDILPPSCNPAVQSP